MRSITLCINAFAIVLAASAVSAGDMAHLSWSQLMDQSAQEYDDPYRDLSPEQLAGVVMVARLREKAAQGEPIDKDRLSRMTAELTAEGIDVDSLIAKRWIVAERREHAATSGNKGLDGREVVLSGFVIAAPLDADGMATAYLVPERGMCSHMPPPPPNQMVRLRLPGNWQPRAMYQPVRVAGLLAIDPSTHTVQIVDGPVPMQATYQMDVSSIETSALPEDEEAPVAEDQQPAG